jgi:hypothetical protein
LWSLGGAWNAVKNAASGAVDWASENKGLLTNIAVGIGVGIAVGAVCATGVGCVIAAGVIAGAAGAAAGYGVDVAGGKTDFSLGGLATQVGIGAASGLLGVGIGKAVGAVAGAVGRTAAGQAVKAAASTAGKAVANTVRAAGGKVAAATGKLAAAAKAAGKAALPKIRAAVGGAEDDAARLVPGANGALRNASTGRFAPNPARAAPTPSSGTHGNSLASAATTYLYRLEDAAGNYLKTGITSDPAGRYTQGFLADKSMTILTSGSRSEMANLERFIVERDPGPLNREPWAGAFSWDVP